MESLLRAREEKLRGELRADDLIEKNRSRSVERLREAYGDMLLRYNAEHSGDRPRQEMADALTSAGYTVVSAQAEYVPATTVRLEGDNITLMGKMLEMFEDNDDIQAVWHNWENEDDYE